MQRLALANKWDKITGCGAPTYGCLSYEAAAEQMTPDRIIEQILGVVAVP